MLNDNIGLLTMFDGDIEIVISKYKIPETFKTPERYNIFVYEDEKRRFRLRKNITIVYGDESFKLL